MIRSEAYDEIRKLQKARKDAANLGMDKRLRRQFRVPLGVDIDEWIAYRNSLHGGPSAQDPRKKKADTSTHATPKKTELKKPAKVTSDG